MDNLRKRVETDKKQWRNGKKKKKAGIKKHEEIVKWKTMKMKTGNIRTE